MRFTGPGVIRVYRLPTPLSAEEEGFKFSQYASLAEHLEKLALEYQSGTINLLRKFGLKKPTHKHASLTSTISFSI